MWVPRRLLRVSLFLLRLQATILHSYCKWTSLWVFLIDLEYGFYLPTLVTLILFKNIFFTEHFQRLFRYIVILVQRGRFSEIILIIFYIYGHTSSLHKIFVIKIAEAFSEPCGAYEIKMFCKNSKELLSCWHFFR